MESSQKLEKHQETNENNETFRYTYSAERQEEIRKIRDRYLPPREDKMEQLRRLDAGVTKKATIVSLIVGVGGTLLLGLGMSLAMTDMGGLLRLSQSAGMVLGILIGIAGIIILALAYPVYMRTVKKEREKIAPEILRLSEELMK